MGFNCSLCPRNCRADREKSHGYCGVGAGIRIARAAPHYWEEPCISGEFGTGAIFFSGCSLRCGFCQNWEISNEAGGVDISPKRLRELVDSLVSNGVHSISLITGSHFVPLILQALSEPLPVPVVFNCGGYESEDTLKMLEGKVQIYLPDMKFSSPVLAERLCGAKDYPSVAKSAIIQMYRQTGNYIMSENGLLKSGVIIRHLVLPGHVENSLGVLKWIADTFPKGSVLFSLMSQYTPYGRLKETPPFNRRLSEDEYARVEDYMHELGIEDGYVQELDSSGEEYIPQFTINN